MFKVRAGKLASVPIDSLAGELFRGRLRAPGLAECGFEISNLKFAIKIGRCRQATKRRAASGWKL
jgi:hypothetical protein